MKYFKTAFTFESLDGTAVDSGTMETARYLCAAIAGCAGYESFEDTGCGLDGYVQQEQLDDGALKAALADFPLGNITVKYSTTVAEDKNWNEQWEKEGFEPIVIGGKCVIHDLYHELGPDAANCAVNIEIDARQAFGTGTHNTTRMIVEELLGMDLSGKRVLDCGCGTGILSIVASKCGAKEVAAYDIDEWSVDNAKHNAAINCAANISVWHGDASVLNAIGGTFDVVLANINRNILLSDMPAMAAMMRQGAAFIISGFYSEDVPLLKEKAKQCGFELVSQKSSENWTMVSFQS